jgi:ubiquinone/menaquinone biosynthesis C-methylase UbiE
MMRRSRIGNSRVPMEWLRFTRLLIDLDRMDMIYHSLRLMFEDKLFFAPVKNPQRIADMATGTGIWAIDVGDQYEAAEGL